MEYMLTFHILNVYFDETQPHQFKYWEYTFRWEMTFILTQEEILSYISALMLNKSCHAL